MTLPSTGAVAIATPNWLERLVGRYIARALTVWLSSVLAGLGLVCLKFSLALVVGTNDVPASGITPAEIGCEIGACLFLVGICAALGLVPYVVVAFMKTTPNLDAEDKARLTSGITIVVIALATALIAYTADEISDTLLLPVRTWLGGLSHYLVLIVVMLFFVLARAVSPGLWFVLF